MIAEGTQAELVANVGEHDLIIIEGDHDESVLEWCRAVEAVVGAEQTGRGIEVTSSNGTRTIGPLLAAFEAHDVEVPGLQLREPNLEAVFLELTGRALRD
jgi:ABC-2 type transport system ATP-binding protein